MLALLVMSACNIEESNYVLDIPSAESPFEIYVSTSDFTKGELVEDPIDMGSIGLYCAMTGGEEWSSSTQFTKLNNRRFNVSDDGDWVIEGASETWGYEDVSDKYSFFAYSPHSDAAQGVSSTIRNGELVVKYIVPDSSINQPDLMFAVPRKNIFPQVAGGVSLSFVHALSCVSFGVISSLGIEITAIDISGVYGEGELQWDSLYNVPTWSLIGSKDDVFSVEIDDYTLDENNSAIANTGRGYLMMIPQQLSDGATVTLTLSSGETRILRIPDGYEWVAGKSYQYNVNLDDVEGSFIYDSSQISNCYIINAIVGDTAVIQIPIEDRINTFWYEYSGKTKIKIDEDTKVDDVLVEMVWEDFEGDVDFCYKALRDSEGKMAVFMTISSEKQEGNFVFVVSVLDSDGDYETLWSWHLWFTDYNPDAIAKSNESNIFANKDTLYTADGYNGAVHRYTDCVGAVDSEAVWSGIYKDKFIMDRNIGERDVPDETCGAGTIYYQYGCHVALPGVGAEYLSGSTVMPTKWVSGAEFYVTSFYYDRFLYSYYEPYNWCTDSSARISNIIWYDKELLAEDYDEGKSIFDPSPLGWRIPVCYTWSNFTSAKSVGVYSNYGYRDAATYGKLTNPGTEAYVWSANKSENYGYARCLYISDDETLPTKNMYYTTALPIRAIQE